MEDLSFRADALARRYPENESVSEWAAVIDFSAMAMRARQLDRG